MNEINEMPYRILEPGLIWVCSWCHPKTSIFKEFPELATCTISHGICKKHKDEAMSQFRAMRPSGK